jgi:hypothetical protein
VKTVEVLRDHGTDPEARDDNGLTPSIGFAACSIARKRGPISDNDT